MTRQANRPTSIAAEWGKIFFGQTLIGILLGLLWNALGLR